MKQYQKILNIFSFLETDYGFYIHKKYWSYRRYYVHYKKNDMEIFVGYDNDRDISPTIDIFEQPSFYLSNSKINQTKYHENHDLSKLDSIERLKRAAEWLNKYMKDKTV